MKSINITYKLDRYFVRQKKFVYITETLQILLTVQLCRGICGNNAVFSYNIYFIKFWVIYGTLPTLLLHILYIRASEYIQNTCILRAYWYQNSVERSIQFQTHNGIPSVEWWFCDILCVVTRARAGTYVWQVILEFVVCKSKLTGSSRVSVLNEILYVSVPINWNEIFTTGQNVFVMRRNDTFVHTDIHVCIC